MVQDTAAKQSRFAQLLFRGHERGLLEVEGVYFTRGAHQLGEECDVVTVAGGGVAVVAVTLVVSSSWRPLASSSLS